MKESFLCDIVNTKRENKLFAALLVHKLMELTVSQNQLRLCLLPKNIFCTKSEENNRMCTFLLD